MTWGVVAGAVAVIALVVSALAGWMRKLSDEAYRDDLEGDDDW